MAPQIPESLSNILPRRVRKSFGILEIYPDDVSFNSQDPGEKIYILMRSHIAVNIGWVLNFLLMLVLPILAFLAYKIFNLVLVDYDINPIEIIALTPLVNWIMVLLLYYSLTFSYALVNFLDWYFDIYLVTNLRILHVDFKVFTGTSVAEAALVNIEDVSTSTVGLLPSIFDYGDVLVQTAAQKNKFDLMSLSNPNWFRDIIVDLANLARKRRVHKHTDKDGHMSISTILPENNFKKEDP